MTLDLSGLQRLLYRLIVAPEGVAEGLRAEAGLHDDDDPPAALESIIGGDRRLSAVERLDVYANMYFYRLLDALKEDFPAALAVVGEDNFHNLVTAYLAAYPPSHPSMLYAGRHLANFLESHALAERWPFVADLARLERALIDVFHAADAPALEARELAAVAPAEWPEVQIRTHPALALLELRWEVVSVLRAVEAGEDWRPPKGRATSVLVWRKQARVFYRELDDQDEAAALRRLEGGASLAALCEQVEASATAQAPPAVIVELLQRWLGDGVLTRAAR